MYFPFFYLSSAVSSIFNTLSQTWCVKMSRERHCFQTTHRTSFSLIMVLAQVDEACLWYWSYKSPKKKRRCCLPLSVSHIHFKMPLLVSNYWWVTWRLVDCGWMCVLVGKCKAPHVSGKTEDALCGTDCVSERQKEGEFVYEGWGFGHLPSDKISWQGNQRETNSAATRVQLSRSSPWWAFEKWSSVEIGFVWEASDLSLVRIIATCLHWLQRSVN